MPFSLSLLIIVIYVEYIAIKKERKNEKRRCVHNLNKKYTSSTKAI